MSRIRTNLITNRMANGAPTVSNGLVISGVTTVTTLDLNGDLDVDGHLNADNVSIAGVVTATSFVGGLPITSGADNRVITASSASAIQGEANLTFDGTNLSIGGNVPEITLTDANSSGTPVCKFSAAGGNINFQADTGNGKADTYIAFSNDGSEKVRITSTGMVGIGTDNVDSPLEVVGTGPSLVTIHHGDGGTNDEARIMLGALPNNPPDNRGAGIAAVNNGAGHDLTIKCSTNHSSGPSEKVRITSGGNVLPGADNTQNLGSSSKRWANLYSGDLNLSNEGSSNNVDGTWGDWTLQEGEIDVFMINNRSGKKFKIKMEEVS